MDHPSSLDLNAREEVAPERHEHTRNHGQDRKIDTDTEMRHVDEERAQRIDTVRKRVNRREHFEKERNVVQRKE